MGCVYVDEPKQHAINKPAKALLGPQLKRQGIGAVSCSPINGLSGFY